jgi:hypothetical protein
MNKRKEDLYSNFFILYSYKMSIVDDCCLVHHQSRIIKVAVDVSEYSVSGKAKRHLNRSYSKCGVTIVRVESEWLSLADVSRRTGPGGTSWKGSDEVEEIKSIEQYSMNVRDNEHSYVLLVINLREFRHSN